MFVFDEYLGYAGLEVPMYLSGSQYTTLKKSSLPDALGIMLAMVIMHIFAEEGFGHWRMLSTRVCYLSNCINI